MTSKELTRKVFIRLGKLKLILLICGVGCAILFYLLTKTISVEYTGTATIFPLTASNESSSTSNLLKELTGASEMPKSFSQEASINIVELAMSRRTREAVALERLPQFGNKTISELLIDAENDKKSFLSAKIDVPKTDSALKAVGGEILNKLQTAKFTKNGLLELSFTNTNKQLITPVTNIIINKISQFYIDLKIRKAREDYMFTMRKLDSLNEVLDAFDKRAITMANTTMFVPGEKIEYTIPKENLITDKERVLRQKAGAANNREEALWRLQKATPIIETLDKPEPPFKKNKPSGLLFGIVGFILGLLLSSFILIFDLLYKYINAEINHAVFGDEAEVAESKTEASATSKST